MAPGLTVKSRLSVLNPNSEGNYFEIFNIIPHALFDRLRQGMVLIHNWHTLSWETDEESNLAAPDFIHLFSLPFDQKHHFDRINSDLTRIFIA